MLPNAIIFIIVLSILIFIHEFGHFFAAKKLGIKVEEFGFGYPPRLIGKKIGETIYSINLIPFGGFVRLLGQEKGEKKKWKKSELKRAFFTQKKWKRIIVLTAGVLGNFFLGIVCFSYIHSKIGIPQKLGYVKVEQVIKDSPADKAGIKTGAKIIAVDNKTVETIDQLVSAVDEKAGREIQLKTKKQTYKLTPRINPPEGQGKMGIVITDIKMAFYPWWQMPFLGAWEGIKEALSWTIMIVQGMVLTFRQLIAGKAPQVAGPVGIFQLTSTAAQQGFLQLVQFVGILSINLGVLNLLPFPALDGGHVVFVFLGDVLKAKNKEKWEHYINMAGFIILISLMIVITINDFSRLFENFRPLQLLKGIF